MIGEVSAIVGKIGEPYVDGTVLLPGCVTSEVAFLSLWAHTAIHRGAVAGRGTITEEGPVIVFRGAFFDDVDGRFARTMLRRLGKTCQWSIAYKVLDNELRGRRGREGFDMLVTRALVGECSPCMYGAAGRITKTLSIDGVPV